MTRDESFKKDEPGAHPRKGIKGLFDFVMADLGYEGWHLRWMRHDAFCWAADKQIDICPMESFEECQQMLLHEIAHIKYRAHGEPFFHHLEELTRRYLNADLSQQQLEMRRIYVGE